MTAYKSDYFDYFDLVGGKRFSGRNSNAGFELETEAINRWQIKACFGAPNLPVFSSLPVLGLRINCWLNSVGRRLMVMDS